MDYKQLKNTGFWDKAWHDDRESSLFRRGRKTLQDTVNFWEKRADNFQKNVMGKKGDKRVNRVMRWLERQGVDLAGKDVLDIGAGPGAFTLALADRCRQVVALEPAEMMVKYLESEIAGCGCKNVRIVKSTWEEVDLEKESFIGAFDLVFASMSPGINNLETINKALHCSKEYFYYSGFAGKRENNLIKELWPLLYGETLTPWPDQVIFVLNLLYTMEFELNFEIWEERSSKSVTMTEAMANILEELHISGKEPPFPEEKLRNFLLTKLRDGVLPQQNRTRLGQLLVRKQNIAKGEEA